MAHGDGYRIHYGYVRRSIGAVAWSTSMISMMRGGWHIFSILDCSTPDTLPGKLNAQFSIFCASAVS